MLDVAVYLGSLPKITNHGVKQEVMRAFAEGARSQGARVELIEERRLVPARLGVMIGWCSFGGGGPHIHFRQDIVDFQRNNGNRVMPIDGSCFKFADPNTLWLRYSIDSIFWNEGNYANRNSTPDHWNMIQQELGLRMQPWRSAGDHILICLQRDGGWSGKGFDQGWWLKKTIKHIRSVSSRPIIIRPHPASKNSVGSWASKDNITISHGRGTTLQQDLNGAHAAVFYNSSSAVAAALNGIPIFVSDRSCVALDVANTDVGMIETPSMPDRTCWIHDLAGAHWSLAQSRGGAIYQKFLPWL